MAQLIVRNVDSSIVERLKRRAAGNGRSAEAEHREILREALAPRRGGLKAYLMAMPDAGSSRDFRIRRAPARKVRL
jgi:plasmid stability protein